MENKKEHLIPPKLMMFDGIGMILLGIGLAKYFTGAEIIPPYMRFENYDTTFMLIGFTMMLPAIIHLIRKVRASK